MREYFIIAILELRSKWDPHVTSGWYVSYIVRCILKKELIRFSSIGCRGGEGNEWVKDEWACSYLLAKWRWMTLVFLYISLKYCVSRWPENRASRATGTGCFHDNPYYSVSNESERKRTLMLETGHQDIRPRSSSGTFWSLWTSLYIYNIAMDISVVSRPNSQCMWTFFAKYKAVLSKMISTDHIWDWALEMWLVWS